MNPPKTYFYSYHIYGANGTKMHFGHGCIEVYEYDDVDDLIFKRADEGHDMTNKSLHLIALNKL